jgi:hypothetical protein
MHGDPVRFLIERRQQPHNLAIVLLPKKVKAPSTVFSTAPESRVRFSIPGPCMAPKFVALPEFVDLMVNEFPSIGSSCRNSASNLTGES